MFSTKGFGPTPIVAVTRFVAGSMRETVPSPMFGTHTLPSGAIVPSCGIGPTFTTASTLSVRASRWRTTFSTLQATQRLRAFAANQAGLRWLTSIARIRSLDGSIRYTNVLVFAATQTAPAVIDRPVGADSVSMRRITFPVLGSMRSTVPSPSFVVHTEPKP